MVEVSSLSLNVTQSEKDKGGWWLMTQKDGHRERERERERSLISPP